MHLKVAATLAGLALFVVLRVERATAILAGLALFVVRRVERGLGRVAEVDRVRHDYAEASFRSALRGGGSNIWPEHDGAVAASDASDADAPTHGVLPEGDYSFVHSEPSNAYGRVLLYATSHFSAQHELYLKHCWKNVVARSPLLQHADVAVYLNPNDPERRGPAVDAFKDAFAGNNLKIYLRGPDEKLTKWSVAERTEALIKTVGAVWAMQEAVARGYFDGYDWVIRLNPDVLVRDDLALREAVTSPDVAAVLINCHHATNKLTHTDFFAIRPEVLPREIVAEGKFRNNAERTFQKWIQESVLDRKAQVWIHEASPKDKRTCRAGQGKDFFVTPVVHEHYLHPDICTVPDDEWPAVAEAFPRGWPENWKRV